jgi:hypothetical protein
MPFPDDLLEQSRHLANRDPRRPRQANLRRAVSTAYYALFHLLTTAAALNWRVGRHRDILARVFQHRNMKTACLEVKKWGSRAGSTDAKHLRIIADAFALLQQDRHAADYDNSRQWTRAEALEHVEMASAAFESWDAIAGHPLADDFLLQLLIQR